MVHRTIEAWGLAGANIWAVQLSAEQAERGMSLDPVDQVAKDQIPEVGDGHGNSG